MMCRILVETSLAFEGWLSKMAGFSCVGESPSPEGIPSDMLSLLKLSRECSGKPYSTWGWLWFWSHRGPSVDKRGGRPVLVGCPCEAWGQSFPARLEQLMWEQTMALAVIGRSLLELGVKVCFGRSVSNASWCSAVQDARCEQRVFLPEGSCRQHECRVVANTRV